MTSLKIGYLFKKFYVTYNNTKHEIFEFVDYITGINFTNTENNDRCNIITGKYAGYYASQINKDGNEEEFVFIDDSLDEAIKRADKHVDFSRFRKEALARTSKYYLRSGGGTSLTRLLNEDLLDFLENRSTDNSEYDEEELKKTSDISTMYSQIKKTIISQDEQIMQILTAIFKNQRVINSNLDKDLITKLKENIFVCGATGTGKTEILKRIAKLHKVPIVIEDATSLSETGYQGRNITDMLENLYLATDKDLDLAEKGILVIDEFDKLAEKPEDSQSHVSRLGVQRSLLKLLDGATFYFDSKKFDTSKLTIVVLGAFTGITEDDDYKQLKEENFIRYGIIRELIGRFSKPITMNPLFKEDIIKILKESDFSPLNTYKELFDLLGVEFSFDEDFIEYIADLAIEKQSGARSLKTVFDNCISSALFRIFAGEYSSILLVKPSEDSNDTAKPYILTKK